MHPARSSPPLLLFRRSNSHRRFFPFGNWGVQDRTFRTNIRRTLGGGACLENRIKYISLSQVTPVTSQWASEIEPIIPLSSSLLRVAFPASSVGFSDGTKLQINAPRYVHPDYRAPNATISNGSKIRLVYVALPRELYGIIFKSSGFFLLPGLPNLKLLSQCSANQSDVNSNELKLSRFARRNFALRERCNAHSQVTITVHLTWISFRLVSHFAVSNMCRER